MKYSTEIISQSFASSGLFALVVAPKAAQDLAVAREQFHSSEECSPRHCSAVVHLYHDILWGL